MIKILLCGSPCTNWSIIQNAKTRETQPSGKGWNLFENFLIAKNKFQPDFFLFENNSSASLKIKEQIERELGYKRIEINSSLVSAQNRKRFYVCNWEIELPQDRKILLKDILEDGDTQREKSKCVRVGGRHSGWGDKHEWDMPNPKRTYTLKEIHRLQTLPDNYCKAISDSAAWKCLGNGWTAEVIIYLLSKPLMNFPKEEEIIVLSMYDGIATGRYCLEQLGFKNIKYYSYEIDKNAIKVAQDNYPDITQLGDAFSVREKEDLLFE